MATIKDGKGTYVLGAVGKDDYLKVYEIGRPAVGPKDVAIDIQYCGMCHSGE